MICLKCRFADPIKKIGEVSPPPVTVMSHDWSLWLEQSEVTSNASVRQPKRGGTLQCHKMIIQCAILTPPEQPTAPFASVHVQLQLGLDVCTVR